MFSKLIALIGEYAHDGFYDATEKLNKYIETTSDFIDILEQIGTIPEAIAHDSTEEKLFAKVSDAVLSRAFCELGLKSTVLSERADSADVFAQSDIHAYTLVADAKAFRLSRTAKNQKDFKITALSGWRKESDYAVLCAPYFQYPRVQSQIYAQAVEHNVCLLSWEHLLLLLRHGIKESETMNLSELWNFSDTVAKTRLIVDRKKCFMRAFDAQCLTSSGLLQDDLTLALQSCVMNIQTRGEEEKAYWKTERERILSYTHEQAITELIKSKKIDEKIRQIDIYIKGIRHAG